MSTESKTPTPTPRTDAANKAFREHCQESYDRFEELAFNPEVARAFDAKRPISGFDFARQLETELSEAKQELADSLVKWTPTRAAILAPANCGVHGHFKFQENGGHCMMCQNTELIKSERNQLRTEVEQLRKVLIELLEAAGDFVDYDQENQVPVCRCCGMELEQDGTGHKQNCLAELILRSSIHVIKAKEQQ